MEHAALSVQVKLKFIVDKESTNQWIEITECRIFKKKDVVMGLYTLTFTFMLSSLPCLHTFWHAIPTYCYIFGGFFPLVCVIFVL